MDNNKLIVSQSPHIYSTGSINKIMLTVIIALTPATLFSFYLFGIKAFVVTAVSIGCAVLFEWFIVKYLLKRASTIWDLSAVVTGLLLALNVPSNIPLWMIAIGALVAIGVGKMSFGGLGQNPFNPAIIGRIFMLISFPVNMTSWPLPHTNTFSMVDATTGATCLGVIKEGLKSGETMSQLMDKIPNIWHLFLGQMGGSMGEMSALLLLIGGIYLLIKKTITWHIPVSIFATVAIFSEIFHLVNPMHYPSVAIELLAGGLFLGAIFMATDYASSPMSKAGQIIFGVGIGLITMIIRYWGAYPEGVSFAILIMNALVPLINRGFKPHMFGALKKQKA